MNKNKKYKLRVEMERDLLAVQRDVGLKSSLFAAGLAAIIIIIIAIALM